MPSKSARPAPILHLASVWAPRNLSACWELDILNESENAESRLVEANTLGSSALLTQVRRLITHRRFFAAAELLAQQRPATTFDDAVRTVYDLCVSASDHLRLADELAAAAGQHREAALTIRAHLDKLLLANHGSRLGGLWLRMRARYSGSTPLAPPAEVLDVSDSTVPSAAQALAHAPPTLHVEPEPDVTVAALGPLEVAVRGASIRRWGSQKNRTLFEYLVLHADRPARREVLMEILWPGHSLASARNNLNVCIYSLRHTLQGPPSAGQHVVYRDGCYLLNPELTWWIDRDEFLALIGLANADVRARRPGRAIMSYQRATELYRGALFEDDPNRDWFASEQRSLQELYLRALEELAALQMDGQDVESARRSAQRVLDEDACRESAHRLLMRCYSRLQQRSLIVRQFRLCISALRAELSVSPAEETVRLFEELTMGDHKH